MPENTAYPDLITDSESLLSAYDQNANLLTGGDSVRIGLEGALTNLKDLKAEQENFAGHRQVTTQRLKEAAEATREAARRMRGFVKSRLGTKSEHLAQFGIAPIRARRQRTPKVDPPVPDQPPAPEAPAPAEQVVEKVG
jgi:hypothetical protein